MEFRLLGSVEALIDGVPIDVGPARQRGVLAALLVDVGRVVSTEDLVERVWGPAQPRQARPTLYSYLSRLRGALEGGPSLSRRRGGYLLAADPASVDLHRFRDLCERARSTPDDQSASVLFAQALGLWQGTAFADIDTPYFHLQREAVGRERLAAQLDHGDVLLRLGRHGPLLAELFTRAEAHPLDERVAGQLMLALLRGGRAADALAHYRLTRRRLRDELGCDPGTPLQRLHERILAGDPGLIVSPSIVQSIVQPAGPFLKIPRQLPAPPAVFVGRTRELAELDRVASGGADDSGTAGGETMAGGGTMAGRETIGGDGTTGGGGSGGGGASVALATIGGTGGIGKTTLALHWAHRNTARFPDGQLYADLRGFDPAAEPVPASVALHGFLEALGVAPAGIPADLADRSALYRSLVAGRRILVLLDNARSTAQVEPLLPGSTGCMVLVTGRRQLAGLVTTAGARPLTLDALPSDEGRELLMHHLGRSRAAREPEATAALVAHCAGLPLATSIVAARARIQSTLPLAALAEELEDRSARLDALDADDLNADLRAVFAASYQALEPPLARVFGLLGAAPGPDIGLSAAAELLGQPDRRVRTSLRRLTTAYLLQEHAPSRYRMHDLVHLYAAECGARDQPAGAVLLARQRLAAYYAEAALAADRVLAPQRTPIVPHANRHADRHSGPIAASPARERSPIAASPDRERSPIAASPDRHRGPADAVAAMAWFAAEYECLMAIHRAAAEDGQFSEAWWLAWALDTYQWRRGMLTERADMLKATLPSTQALADHGALALNHRLLGRALVPLGRHESAVRHFGEAMTEYEAAGDPDGQAQTQINLALAWERAGDDAQALTHAQQNLRIRGTLGNPARQAEALNAVGWYHARLGHHDDAERFCRCALALCREHDFAETEGYTRDSLGFIALHSGRPTEALRHYSDALRLRRTLGDAYEEADTLAHLGKVYQALGRPAEAGTAWRAALAMYETQGRLREAAEVRQRLKA